MNDISIALAGIGRVSGVAPSALLQPAQLRSLVYESSSMAYAVAWGLYLPFWALHGYIALTP